MKKSSILLGALLVASSFTFAAEPASTPMGNDTNGATPKRGLRDVGPAFRQMGRDARGAAHDVAHPRDRNHVAHGRSDTGYGGDTRADMSGDGARRQRMDAAYSNWQGKR
ncbi:MAG: hypothetical protein EOO28_18450 [Comamonadaceae bacterium]|nr:MAG: hypothetical protein EOO28_18450 [Comamonadaceae bacterium]